MPFSSVLIRNDGILIMTDTKAITADNGDVMSTRLMQLNDSKIKI